MFLYKTKLLPKLYSLDATSRKARDGDVPVVDTMKMTEEEKVNNRILSKRICITVMIMCTSHSLRF